MRHIDVRNLESLLPDTWETRARAVLLLLENKTQEINAATTDIDRKEREKERKKIISDNGDLWSELKDILMGLSEEKCWYCESRQGRSDNAVDHFRPKGRVIECPAHSGYWWLAFDWENYRFSCTYCNCFRKEVTTAGGKQDHFPIMAGSTRAMNESESHDIERPVMLDPIVPSDVRLLNFSITGQPVSRYQKNEKPDVFLRVHESIRFYHLNHNVLVKERISIYSDIKRKILMASRYINDADNGDRRAINVVDNVLSDLRLAIKASSPHSAAAYRYILSFKLKHAWVERVFEI